MIPILKAAGVGLIGFGIAKALSKKPSPPSIPAPKTTEPLPPQYKPQPPPVLNHPDSPRSAPVPPTAPVPKPVQIDVTLGGNPVVVTQPTNPDTGKPTVTATLAVAGGAVGPARNLYDYLKANGITPSPRLKELVFAFQKAHNADSKGVATGGRLTEDGLYGPRTSAALTIYTGLPVPPDPNIAADRPKDGNLAGPAAIAASNLYAHLKAKGNDRSGTLKALVTAFQKAVNSDPSFPGPAMPFANARIIKEPLAVDGLYGPKTSDALAVSTFERIKP